MSVIEVKANNFDSLDHDYRPPHALKRDRMRTCYFRVGPMQFGASYSDVISWSAYVRFGRVTFEMKGRTW